MLTVGRVAQRAGLSAKAVRFYEEAGLIDPPERTGAGYRVYTEQTLPVLHFIRRAQALGLRLKEIKRILDLRRTGEAPCSFVTGLLDERIEEVDQRIAELQSVRAALQAARRHEDGTGPNGDPGAICPIIESASLLQTETDGARGLPATR